MSKTLESAYPAVVNVYRQRYDKMAKLEYIEEFKHFAKTVLKDPVEGLGWKGLLAWEHRHLEYTRGVLPKPRAEMPMDIMATKPRIMELMPTNARIPRTIEAKPIRPSIPETALPTSPIMR